MGVDLVVKYVVGIKLPVTEGLYMYRDVIGEYIWNESKGKVRLHFTSEYPVPSYLLHLTKPVDDKYYFTPIYYDENDPNLEDLEYLFDDGSICKQEFYSNMDECITSAWSIKLEDTDGLKYLQQLRYRQSCSKCRSHEDYEAYTYPDVKDHLKDRKKENLLYKFYRKLSDLPPLFTQLPPEIQREIYMKNVHLYKIRYFSY